MTAETKEKEGRKEERKEGRKEGRKEEISLEEGFTYFAIVIFYMSNIKQYFSQLNFKVTHDEGIVAC